MKFYIEIIHPMLGEIKSETFNESLENFNKIKATMVNENMNSSMDFFTHDGSYVIISPPILNNSLRYLRILDDES